MKLILVLFRLSFVRPPVHPLDLLLFVWTDRRGLRQYGLSEVYRMSKTAVFRNSLWTLGDGGEEKKWKKYFNQSYFRFLFFKIYIIFHYCAVKRNICNYPRFLSIWIVVCHCFDIVNFFLFPLAYLSATVRSIDLPLGYREWWMKPAITSKTCILSQVSSECCQQKEHLPGRYLHFPLPASFHHHACKHSGDKNNSLTVTSNAGLDRPGQMEECH